MAETEKTCGVMLIRHGERESNDPNAGLKTKDSGKERGEEFVKEAIQTYKSDEPPDRLYYAPTRIARETA